MVHDVIYNGFNIIKVGLEKEAKRFGPHAARYRIQALQKMFLQLEAKYICEELEDTKNSNVHVPEHED